MIKQNQLNLEELLEHMGSVEVPGDTKHRYRLRRALLRSRCFETNRVTAKFVRIFTMTTGVVAGGALIMVFIVAIRATAPQIGKAPVTVVKETPSILPPIEVVAIDESLEEMREFAKANLEFAIAP